MTKQPLQSLKIFVIHVRGCVQREKHIRQMMASHGLDFEFILKGNKEDLTDQVLHMYFKGDRLVADAATSCAFKHICAWEKMSREPSGTYALVLEDDIILSDVFNDYIGHMLRYADGNNIRNFYVALENDNYNTLSDQERTCHHDDAPPLVLKNRTKCAGAYLLDTEFARHALEDITAMRTDLPIDWYLSDFAERGVGQIYWSRHCVAEQASLSGRMDSLINKRRKNIFKVLAWKIKKMIKKID